MAAAAEVPRHGRWVKRQPRTLQEELPRESGEAAAKDCGEDVGLGFSTENISEVAPAKAAWRGRRARLLEEASREAAEEPAGVVIDNAAREGSLLEMQERQATHSAGEDSPSHEGLRRRRDDPTPFSSMAAVLDDATAYGAELSEEEGEPDEVAQDSAANVELQLHMQASFGKRAATRYGAQLQRGSNSGVRHAR
eukprot:TRINITY_DN111157_c0_g1_i1.p1 TRINITY_DN111157_c0_g1~~TRINITY_DN111157_c0_g1_i1.p1  ORF type:complete len:212 (+),score=61.11 TRINITY_DN111157_c0_g1_i1:53-637(+)